ncbi:MAG: NAD(P)-dependent oxidoreductase [Bauldia sp.]
MIAGRALVTGATGFVGSHLVRRLVRDGLDVHILRRERSDFWRMADVLPRVTGHIADLRDAPALRAAVAAARPDYVFHLAAATVVAGATDGAADLIAVNLLGTVNLIEACEAVGFRGMVTTGDSFEYTPSMHGLSEAAPSHATGLHGITKLAATLHAEAVAKERGRPIVTLRLFSTYGPFDHPKRLVPRAIAGALAGTDLPLASPDIARDWVYIDDVVALYLEAAMRAGELAADLLDAGSGILGSIGDVVEAILRLTGSKAVPRWGTFHPPEHDRFPWVADTTHAFSRLQWRPVVSLEDGLSRTIEAARRGTNP